MQQVFLKQHEGTVMSGVSEPKTWQNNNLFVLISNILSIFFSQVDELINIYLFKSFLKKWKKIGEIEHYLNCKIVRIGILLRE